MDILAACFANSAEAHLGGVQVLDAIGGKGGGKDRWQYIMASLWQCSC